MTIRSIALCGGLLMLAALTPSTASATPTIGACSPTKSSYVVSIRNSQRSSTTFGNVPETSVNFVQGGAKASCVIVRFSATTFGAKMMVRAFLDGVTVSIPDEVLFSSGDNNGLGGAHSFEFVFRSVAPGSHIVRMQYRSDPFAPGTVTMQRHITVVQHAP